MMRQKILKRFIKTLLGFLILYSILWGTGYYRVWSYEKELRQEHNTRGKEIEDFIDGLKVGDPAQPVRSFRYSKQGKTKYVYWMWYYNHIDENSAVSNRGEKAYQIFVDDEVIVSIELHAAMTHGDIFASPFRYYPSVALFGLETDELE